MNGRRPDARFAGGGAVIATLVVVLFAGVLLPWWLTGAGVRWSAAQAAILAIAAVAIAVVVLGRYARQRGGFARRRVRVATATLLALVVASALLIVLRARVDQIRAEMPDATMTVAGDGRVLRVEGYIGDDFVATLGHRLAGHPGVRRIDITSAGGLVDEALRAADVVRAHSLRVRVVEQCASGCVLVWAATVSREMHVAALIGLHRVRLDPTLPDAWEPGVRGKFEAESLAILRAAGLSEEMLARRTRTATEDMAWFDAGELLDEGVVVTVVDDDGTPLTRRGVERAIGQAP